MHRNGRNRFSYHVMLQHQLFIILLLSSHFICNKSDAFEEFVSLPGTRAMGMAGVFSAQADDSSAILYNPAGLKRPNAVKKDFSIEYANSPTRNATKSLGAINTEESEYGNLKTRIKFAAVYLDHLPFSKTTGNDFGTGIAYYSPLELILNIDAPRNPIDPLPFGLTKATYQQLSASLSRMINSSFSVGGTLDFVLTAIDCLNFSPCVNNGPAGFGLTLGTLHKIYQDGSMAINFGAIWRSKAALKYSSTPGSGIGTVLESYIPDRPESRNIGLNLQFPASWAFINTNIVYEQTLWSNASGINPRLVDYNTTGISTEILLPIAQNQSLALRAGLRKSENSNTGDLSGAHIMAVGLGYGFSDHHIVDVAFESRKTKSAGKKSINLISFSFSQQY